MRLFALFMLLSLLLFAKPLEKITLQLQWKHQFEFAGFYMAKEKGFYKEVGLDVELLEYDGKGDIGQSVLDGKAHYGVSYSSTIAQYLEGKPFVLIANFFKQSPLVLVAQKEISSPAQLKGKKVMGVSDTIDSITLINMLHKFGVDLKDIQSIPTTFTLDKFINREVDAMSVFTTNELYYLNQKKIPYTLLDPTVYGSKFYDVNLFTTKYEAQNNPLRVKSFKEASIRGWEYALKHKEEAIRLIKDKYNSQNKSMDALRFEAKQIEQIMLPSVYPIGSIDPFRVKLIAESFKQSKFIKSIKEDDLDAFIFAYNHHKIQLSKEERDFLANNPTIRVSNMSNWAPFDFNDQGEPKGYSIDYLQLIQKRLGVKFEYVENESWVKLKELFCQGEIDILHASDEIFSHSSCGDTIKKPYISDTISFATRKEFKSIKSIEDIYGYRIALQKDWDTTKWFIKKYGTKVTPIYVNSTLEGLEAVAQNRADVVADMSSVLHYLIMQKGLYSLKSEGYFDELGIFKLYIMTQKKKKLLHSILSKAMATLSIEELAKLKKQWIIEEKLLKNSKKSIGSQKLLTAIERDYINQHPILKVAHNINRAPYSYDGENKPQGFSVDYMELIASKLGLKIEYIDAKNIQEMLYLSKYHLADTLLCVAHTKELEDHLAFGTPYINSIDSIAVRNSAKSYQNLENFNGKVIAVVEGSYREQLLKKFYPKIIVMPVKSALEGLKGVVFSQFDGFLDDFNVIHHFMMKENLTNLDVAFAVDDRRFNRKLSFATHRDNMLLRDILQKGMELITQEESIALRSKWFGNDAQSFDYQKFMEFIIALAVIIFLIIFWNVRLNRRVAQEVAKNQRQQEMIFQQNKMASMGEMIGNIAHQWRQPLAVMSTVIDILNERNDRDILSKEKLSEKLKLLETNVMQMSQTIEDFLSYFNPYKQKENFSLLEAIQKTQHLVRQQLDKRGVNLDIDVDEKLWVYGYKDEYIQVLISIIVNSTQAFKANSTQRYIYIKSFESKNYIKIEIWDNAGGIEADIIDKIFDPYFSTKEKTQGTGLGLYISKMMIENSMDGKLSAINVKEGAKFIIEVKNDKV